MHARDELPGATAAARGSLHSRSSELKVAQHFVRIEANTKVLDAQHPASVDERREEQVVDVARSRFLANTP